MNNKKIAISVIIVLVISIISLGVAFAAFSSSLNIGGNATVDSATWDIVFEGLDSSSPSTLGAGTPTGTASIVTNPTIKNNSTEISTYEVVLNSPGDSVTYNFKIHNRGTIAARVTNVDIKEGIYLTTDTSKRSSEADTLNNIEYKFYYTQGNADVGDDLEKDCLAPDEEELVTLRIVFLASDDESVLPSSNLLLDNLGITVTYTSETSCVADSGGGNSGSGSSNSQALTVSVGTPTNDGSGSARSDSSPTISNNTITGAVVYLPYPGDEVDYPLSATPSSDGGISGISVPSLQDLITANPSVSTDILSKIRISLHDIYGNEIKTSNKPCLTANMMQNMTLVIKYKYLEDEQPIGNTSIVIPPISFTYSDECNEDLIEDKIAYYESFDLHNKVINGACGVCLTIDSVERCLVPSESTFNSVTNETIINFFDGAELDYYYVSDNGDLIEKYWGFESREYLGNNDRAFNESSVYIRKNMSGNETIYSVYVHLDIATDEVLLQYINDTAEASSNMNLELCGN